MFTGIITQMGTLLKKEGDRFTFKAPQSLVKRLKTGTSIAVDGVCLTVQGRTSATMFFTEVMPETFQKTNLGNLGVGSHVNLELPASPNTFLSGHIVQGHIDAVGKIERIIQVGNSRVLTITIPRTLTWYIVEKGAVAVNGISLTVIKAGKDFFSVGIIPFTWEHTMLKRVKEGDKLNVETDIIGKYVRKFVI